MKKYFFRSSVDVSVPGSGAVSGPCATRTGSSSGSTLGQESSELSFVFRGSVPNPRLPRRGKKRGGRGSVAGIGGRGALAVRRGRVAPAAIGGRGALAGRGGRGAIAVREL